MFGPDAPFWPLLTLIFVSFALGWVVSEYIL